MSTTISMRELFEAGAHFGHRTRYWNPKMAPYIYGARGGIHIINLEQTVPMMQDAINFLGTIAANGGNILFVGTKRAASDTIQKAAVDCGMPYVNQRWLGGMMTNYKTIRQSVRKLHNMRKSESDGSLAHMTKKEIINLRKEQIKLESSLGGIADMKRLPDVLFVADVGHESIAIKEAKTLGIPVVGIVDTNNSPEEVDYIIPCNDDSVRALGLCINAIADGIKNARIANGSASQLSDESAPQENITEPAAQVTAEAAPEAATEVASEVAPKASPEAPVTEPAAADSSEANTEATTTDKG
ncbi:30S ribosomal protein S2 [Ostreibacterium oceani]|uniref:Small ribosomal subunit protein uS2 n=1 Tax=Ostreibacterium oceani TaxID=2654998 RepID=A0A6N7EU97_9GAMM|nr:30S ribosomal protein S2 [Ostreibacterium oceani]